MGAVDWGEGEPEFEDDEHAGRIMGIIMARYNEIIFQLDDEPGAFMPILYSAPDGRVLAADWAEDFMDTFSLRVEAWDPLFAYEDGRYLMGPMMAFLPDEDGKSLVAESVEELEDVIKPS